MAKDYFVLATDGDGTLVRGGHMGVKTVAALKRWKATGRKLVLVTGETARQVDDFPHVNLFDRVVAENGALVLSSDRLRERKLGKPPPRRLLRALKRAGVPLKRGRLIIHADLLQESAICGVLRQLETDWQLVRNRHEVMVVPPGVSKASGLAVVLEELGIAPRLAVAIGDAENDGPLLKFCGLGVAVNNAVAKLKRQSSVVTRGQYGKGIAELIDKLLAGDMRFSKRRRRPRRRSSRAP